MELKKFIKDPRFLIPALFLVGTEVFLQSGLYHYFLKPHTYAENVNRIDRVVHSSPIEPDALIVGTSVAYQGINLPLLNESFTKEPLSFQSIATEGAMLITQNTLYHSVKPRLQNLKTVIHVMEATMPWTARYDLDPANRSMLAQFPRISTIGRIRNYGYNLTWNDLSYIWVRSITYQADLKDLTLDPGGRLKRLGRKYREEARDDFPYVNEQPFGMDVFEPRDLKECMEMASQKHSEVNEKGETVTDHHHIKAMYQTCELGLWDPMENIASEQWQELFFKRLARFYKEIFASGQRLIIIIPPYSRLIIDHHPEERNRLWKKYLDPILAGHPHLILDLRRSLDRPDNLSLYYDTIHLNRKGSLIFTEILAKTLKDHTDFISGKTEESSP